MVSISTTGNFFLGSILLTLLFITPSFARLSVAVSDNDISYICSKTSDPSLCQALLPSTPGVRSADYPRLAKITLDLATSNASNTVDLVKSLIPKTDYPLKKSYKLCAERVNSAIHGFEAADRDLRLSDPHGFNSRASAALDDAAHCEDELKGSAADPAVVKGSHDLRSICSILLAVSTRLFR